MNFCPAFEKELGVFFFRVQMVNIMYNTVPSDCQTVDYFQT